MFFYLVLYFTATLCAYFYAKARTSAGIWLGKTFLFLILFLPLALRYNIGTDYPNYVDFIRDEYFFKHNYLFFEPGWAPIIYAIEKWNLSLQWFFVVPAFFSILIVLHVTERKYAYFCIPTYISCIAYFESFNIVRQSFAATIFLLCLKHFEQKEYGKTFLWLIVATLFHKSAIILLPILLLASFDWKKLNPYRALAIYAIMVVVLIVYNAATFILTKIVGDTFYANYITSIFNRPAEMNSGLGVLAKQILCILVLFSIRKEEIDDGINQASIRRYSLVCITTLCLAAFQMLAAQIYIFERLAPLLSPFYIYIAICMINSKWKYRPLTCLTFIAILFLLFFATLSRTTTQGTIPYQSILTE